MDNETNEQRPCSTQGGQVRWSDKTRGGYWVRNIEVFNSNGSFHDFRGLVGNHSSEPPSEDLIDWAWETWRSDGRYMADKECDSDLMEAGE